MPLYLERLLWFGFGVLPPIGDRWLSVGVRIGTVLGCWLLHVAMHAACCMGCWLFRLLGVGWSCDMSCD